MTSSPEYTLKRLDKWYADRFGKCYTPEVEREILEHLHTRLEKISGGSAVLTPATIKQFTIEEQIKKAETFFSETYVSLEVLMEDPTSRAVLTSVEKFKQFVKSVRVRSGETIPDELTDNHINEVFLESFGDYQGFTQFWIGYIEAMRGMYGMLVAIGQMDLQSADRTVKLLGLYKEIFPDLMKKVFGDLKQSGDGDSKTK